MRIMRTIELMALSYVICSCIVQAQQNPKPAAPAVTSPDRSADSTGEAPLKLEKTPPPAPCTKPLADVENLDPPVLALEECDPIHAGQVQFLAAQLQINDAQQKLQAAITRRNEVNTTLQQAMERAKKRIGPGWDIDPNSLATSKVQPPAPKKEEPKKDEPPKP